jgi:hypothetical protein
MTKKEEKTNKKRNKEKKRRGIRRDNAVLCYNGKIISVFSPSQFPSYSLTLSLSPSLLCSHSIFLYLTLSSLIMPVAMRGQENIKKNQEVESIRENSANPSLCVSLSASLRTSLSKPAEASLTPTNNVGNVH